MYNANWLKIETPLKPKLRLGLKRLPPLIYEEKLWPTWMLFVEAKRIRFIFITIHQESLKN